LPTNDKSLRVRVANTGQAEPKACRLVLTVREINGVAAGRHTHVTVPSLAAGACAWLLIDAESILPNNVTLESTTFRLSVDATGIVMEVDESNNEIWHNRVRVCLLPGGRSGGHTPLDVEHADR
jgi:hypothetical protein